MARRQRAPVSAGRRWRLIACHVHFCVVSVTAPCPVHFRPGPSLQPKKKKTTHLAFSPLTITLANKNFFLPLSRHCRCVEFEWFSHSCWYSDGTESETRIDEVVTGRLIDNNGPVRDESLSQALSGRALMRLLATWQREKGRHAGLMCLGSTTMSV